MNHTKFAVYFSIFNTNREFYNSIYLKMNPATTLLWKQTNSCVRAKKHIEKTLKKLLIYYSEGFVPHVGTKSNQLSSLDFFSRNNLIEKTKTLVEKTIIKLRRRLIAMFKVGWVKNNLIEKTLLFIDRPLVIAIQLASAL